MRRDDLYLNDIIEAADHIAAFLAEPDFEAFLNSELVRSAVVQKLAVIGEAAAGISDKLRKRHPQTPWPQIAFVTGTSDDGGMPNHAQTTVAQGQGVALNITQTGTVPFSLDLWYPTTDLYTVTIQTPTATYGPYAAPATNTTCSDTQKTADFSYFQCGASNSTWGPVTARQLEIDFTGNPGNYTITIQGTKASGGQFNAWLSTDETAVGASALGAAFTNLSRSGLYHVGRRGGIQ